MQLDILVNLVLDRRYLGYKSYWSLVILEYILGKLKEREKAGKSRVSTATEDENSNRLHVTVRCVTEFH